MNMHAAVDLKWPGLTRPNGDRLRLNDKNFVAIDRDKDAKYEATYRPQALYNRAERRLSCQQRNLPAPRGFDESADLPPRYRPHRFPSSPSAGRLPARAGDVGHVHLRLRWPVLLRRPRCGDAAERDRASAAVLHLVRVIDGRKPEDAADRGAGSDVDGLFRQVSRSLHYRSHDLPQPDGGGSGSDQRSGNATRGLEPSAARSPGRCLLLAAGSAGAGRALQAAGGRSRSNPPGLFMCAISESRFRAAT